MDLSTAQAKLDNGMYTSRDEFVADVRMIISNCYSYNGQASPVRKTGEAFEASFNTSEDIIFSRDQLIFCSLGTDRSHTESICGAHDPFTP